MGIIEYPGHAQEISSESFYEINDRSNLEDLWRVPVEGLAHTARVLRTIRLALQDPAMPPRDVIGLVNHIYNTHTNEVNFRTGNSTLEY